MFTAAFSGSLYGAYAHAWSGQSGIVASVPGVGVFSPATTRSLDWAEYGVQADYRIAANVKLNAFADGLAGGQGIGARLHVGIGVDVGF